MKLSSLKVWLVSVLVFLLSSCASTPSIKTPMPMTGSKADGTVTLAYEYDADERYEVDWKHADIEAKNSCKVWGYHKAKQFGAWQTVCNSYNTSNNCLVRQANVVYQCS